MIVITGASEGIGFACASRVLERTDATVLITGRSTSKLERARNLVPASARSRLRTAVSDQSRRDDVERLIGRLREADAVEGAILTVGVNPAYALGFRRLHLLEPTAVEPTITTNCTHTVLLTVALLDRFRRQGRGALVWVGSRAATTGLPGAALYSATKSFLSGLARATALEYGRHGIRVHLAHPGLVRTPRTAAVADGFAARHAVPVDEPGAVGDRIVDLLLAGNPEAVEVTL